MNVCGCACVYKCGISCGLHITLVFLFEGAIHSRPLKGDNFESSRFFGDIVATGRGDNDKVEERKIKIVAILGDNLVFMNVCGVYQCSIYCGIYTIFLFIFWVAKLRRPHKSSC